jgi:hypothetical protein
MNELRRQLLDKDQRKMIDEKIQQIEKQEQLGATGNFPGGKLTDHDEGEIRIAIGHKNGKVVVAFGKPISWIGFSPEQARELAEHIIKHSHAVEKGE